MTIMRRACLMEDEGIDREMIKVTTEEEAISWISRNGSGYFRTSDFYYFDETRFDPEYHSLEIKEIK